MKDKKPVPDCLYLAGFLGHTWFVTATAPDGSERLRVQTNSGEDAARHFRENADSARIFELVKPKRGPAKFKERSLSAATIS